MVVSLQAAYVVTSVHGSISPRPVRFLDQVGDIAMGDGFGSLGEGQGAACSRAGRAIGAVRIEVEGIDEQVGEPVGGHGSRPAGQGMGRIGRPTGV